MNRNPKNPDMLIFDEVRDMSLEELESIKSTITAQDVEVVVMDPKIMADLWIEIQSNVVRTALNEIMTDPIGRLSRQLREDLKIRPIQFHAVTKKDGWTLHGLNPGFTHIFEFPVVTS